MRHGVITFVLCFALVAPLLSCDGGDTMPPPVDDFDRRAMLESLVDVVVIPTYRDFVTASEELESTAQSFCASPDATSLDAAQDAWWAARGAWKRADGWAFGPYADAPLRLGPKIDFWPVRETNVSAVLVGVEPIDQAFLDGQGVAVKGLPVVEYLLFDPAGGDAAVLAAFGAPEGARRCEYVVALSADLVVRGQEMVTAWDPSAGDYRSEVVDAGEGSVDFLTLHDAVSEMMNRLVFCIENIREMKLAEPQGKRSGGEPRPDSVESRYSDRSFDDILDNLASIEALYTGDYDGVDGVGYQDFLLARRPDLDAEVLARLDDAKRLIAAVGSPLRVAVVDDPVPVEEAFQAVKALHLLFGIEVAQALAVTITFNDTDAD
jgi:predicted lipoprotein